ncbi:serine/threonine protein phosphatase [Streptomyces solincola]|uniref:Serine/threonine protein phosphatase n=1 Tax=Streptomyces solincola TaxID=2100817 RepID=A0A2S9Q310_9ACTN|nr:PP2C family protein-serine/threonine phosphatase [Streptomyces solincola]PRH81064.1 serine/threonine protein phosphatase [Streptomyces solincola]
MENAEREATGLRDDADGVGGAWRDAPCPVVVADRAGTVAALNTAAAAAFPGLRPDTPLRRGAPPWLTAAHRALTASPDLPAPAPKSVRGSHAGRDFTAHATLTAGGRRVVWWLIDDSELSAAREALRGEREQAALLARASGELLSSLNERHCRETTARLSARYLADAAVLVSPGRGGGLPVTYGLRGADPVHAVVRADVRSVPGLTEALQGLPPTPSRWIPPDALPEWAVPPGFEGPVDSVAVIPLPGPGVPAGALILLRRGANRSSSDREEVFARLFAVRAGAALAAARMYAEQAGITATLMHELLPPRLRAVQGVEYAGGYRPSGSGERVGGDFYDVHPGAGGTADTLAVLGDVCGKGLDAAVLTGRIRNTLHALLPEADDHHRLLTLLNSALTTSRHTRFATLVLASVRRLPDGALLRLTSAGHPPPLIVRADGAVEEAATHGSLIGVLPAVHSTTATTKLAPGESCLLFTDGITEARGGPLGDTLFGTGRLRRALTGCARLPAEAIVERVQTLVADWVGPRPHDDMALTAITLPPTTRPDDADRPTQGRLTP